jgi:hypothetical protein
MTASDAELIYDGSTRSQSFVLTGDGCGEPLDVTLQPGASWTIVTPASSSIPIGGSLTVFVFVDLDIRTADSGRVKVTSKAGSFDILITIAIEPEEPPPGSTGGSGPTGPTGPTGGSGPNDGNGGGDETPPCYNCPPPSRGGPGDLTN